MKRFLMLLMLFMGLGSMSLYAQSSRREKAQDADALSVREKIESKSYTVSCSYMYPLRGRSRYVGSDYSIKLKGDTVYSYLPYFGVAYTASYGSKNVLDFEKVCSEYTYKEGKKGSLLVTFTVENENEILEYQLTIYPNGNVRIFIQPNKRDSVSYSGELAL